MQILTNPHFHCQPCFTLRKYHDRYLFKWSLVSKEDDFCQARIFVTDPIGVAKQEKGDEGILDYKRFMVANDHHSLPGKTTRMLTL